MDVCVAHGISYSHFRGGPPVWTQHDRDLAVWHQTYKSQTCSCGTRPDEWDPANGGHLHAYVAKRRRCYGCQRIAKKQDEIPESDRGFMHVYLEKRGAGS